MIDDELVRFMQGPVSAMLATCDPTGFPDATRVCGLVALDGSRLRVLVSSEAHAALGNATPGVSAAVLVTDITDYRSLQLKGKVAPAPASRTPGDVAVFDAHVRAFCAASATVGIPADEADRIFPVDTTPLIIEIEALYDQTPGPGAGRRIEAGA